MTTHRPDDFTARFLARVTPEVAATFTPAQLAAVRQAFGMRYAVEHAVDIRRGIRLPWARYYLVLLAGREIRDAPRGHRGAWAAASLATALLMVLTAIA